MHNWNVDFNYFTKLLFYLISNPTTPKFYWSSIKITTNDFILATLDHLKNVWNYYYFRDTFLFHMSPIQTITR